MSGLRPIAGRLWIIQLAEELSRRIARHVKDWPEKQKESLGHQFLRSTDSIGERLSEGYARTYVKERRYFISIALGSLEEALFQLRRARERELIPLFEAKTLSGLFIRLSKAIQAYSDSLRDDEEE